MDYSPIISKYKWPTSSLTYSFMKSVATTYANDPAFALTFAPITPAMQSAMTSIFRPATTGDSLRPAYFSDVSNLTFSLSSGTGDIAIGSYQQPTASGFPPDGTSHGGDVWLNPSYTSPTLPGTYQHFVILHEIGHALGLEHGSVYPNGGYPDLPNLEPRYDSVKYTIMSYNYDSNAGGLLPIGLQQFDIAALQEQYGANFATRAGDTIYNFSSSAGVLTIWDGGGVDKIDASTLTTDLVIDLQPGHFSSIGGKENVTMALVSHLSTTNQSRPLIETANGGAGDDLITGNKGANLLNGGAGTNTLHGLDGNDILVSTGTYDVLRGGPGNDYLGNLQLDGKTDYIFGRGDGHDFINDNPYYANGDIDIIINGAGPSEIELHVNRYKVYGPIEYGEFAGMTIYRYSPIYLEINGSNDTLVLPWQYRDEYIRKTHEILGDDYLNYEQDSIQFRGGVAWDIEKDLEKYITITDVQNEADLVLTGDLVAALNNQLFLYI